MARIGIFSGSFNPIHKGHVALARHMLLFAGLDEVWMVVSPQNPLKNQHDLMDEQERLRLVNLALQEETGIYASNVEFALPRPSFTWQTLCALRQQYPHHIFSLIIGSDNMLLFDKWRNWQAILENFRVVVYPRPGYESWEEQVKYPQMELVKAPLMDVSSTQVRQALQKKDLNYLREALPAAVFEEISKKILN